MPPKPRPTNKRAKKTKVNTYPYLQRVASPAPVVPDSVFEVEAFNSVTIPSHARFSVLADSVMGAFQAAAKHIAGKPSLSGHRITGVRLMTQVVNAN